MGEAKRRAQRRREALAEGKSEPAYAPKVPQLVELKLMVTKRLAEQIEMRRAFTTYTPADFLGQLLVAGIRAFDAEVEHVRRESQMVKVATPAEAAKATQRRPDGSYIGSRSR